MATTQFPVINMRGLGDLRRYGNPFSIAMHDAAEFDAYVGGVVHSLQTYGCPACGAIALKLEGVWKDGATGLITIRHICQNCGETDDQGVYFMVEG